MKTLVVVATRKEDEARIEFATEQSISCAVSLEQVALVDSSPPHNSVDGSCARPGHCGIMIKAGSRLPKGGGWFLHCYHVNIAGSLPINHGSQSRRTAGGDW